MSKMVLQIAMRQMGISTTPERTLAGIFANASACGTGKRALLAAHHSIPVGHLLAFLSSFAACFNLVLLVHVAAWLAARTHARPRNARRPLELPRAARHLAASDSSRGPRAARLPAALPRATVYLPPPCCLRRAAPNPQPPSSRGGRDRLCDACPCLCHAPAPSRDVPASGCEKPNCNQTAIV